mmetsp:Transcript_36239/g.95533  ORF Transcript_36239/g.95533 Transcript_36239/m.95533 type:complete len:447 (-) Transcript_36239:595-1935(-)
MPSRVENAGVLKALGEHPVEAWLGTVSLSLSRTFTPNCDARPCCPSSPSKAVLFCELHAVRDRNAPRPRVLPPPIPVKGIRSWMPDGVDALVVKIFVAFWPFATLSAGCWIRPMLTPGRPLLIPHPTLLRPQPAAGIRSWMVGIICSADMLCNRVGCGADPMLREPLELRLWSSPALCADGFPTSTRGVAAICTPRARLSGSLAFFSIFAAETSEAASAHSISVSTTRTPALSPRLHVAPTADSSTPSRVASLRSIAASSNARWFAWILNCAEMLAADGTELLLETLRARRSLVDSAPAACKLVKLEFTCPFEVASSSLRRPIKPIWEAPREAISHARRSESRSSTRSNSTVIAIGLFSSLPRNTRSGPPLRSCIVLPTTAGLARMSITLMLVAPRRSKASWRVALLANIPPARDSATPSATEMGRSISTVTRTEADWKVTAICEG